MIIESGLDGVNEDIDILLCLPAGRGDQDQKRILKGESQAEHDLRGINEVRRCDQVAKQ